MRYSNIQPPFTLKFHEMPNEEVKAYGVWFHEIMPSRLAELAGAVQETSGFESWKPDLTPPSLERLGEWFARQVQTEPRTAEEIDEIERNLTFPIDIPSEDLTIRTFSLAMDIGMYLGEVVRVNIPRAKWEQLKKGSKRNVDYGHMLVVWPATPVPMNPVQLIVTLAYGLADKTKDGSRLAKIYTFWTERKKTP